MVRAIRFLLCIAAMWSMKTGVGRLLLTEEGYVTLSDKKYHYYLQDHQGNNRVVLSSSGAVEEANHYYPFGGVFASSGNVQPYKYNGKELDAKKGLNWYDYGASIMMRHWVGLRLMTDLLRSIIRCLRISMGLIIVVPKNH